MIRPNKKTVFPVPVGPTAIRCGNRAGCQDTTWPPSPTPSGMIICWSGPGIRTG